MRFEDKYIVFPGTSVEQLFEFNRYGFKEVFQERQVNSIYFDDRVFSCFNENLEGNPNRTKIRLRWYGDAPLSSTLKKTLEVKWKKSGVGGKDNFTITNTFDEQDSVTYVLKELRTLSHKSKSASLGRALRMMLLEREIIKISYVRKYFFSESLQCRATVDNHLSAYPMCEEFRALNRRVSPTFRVVELKYDVSESFEARQYSNSLEIPRRSCSKYSWGVSQFNGQILANV